MREKLLLPPWRIGNDIGEEAFAQRKRLLILWEIIPFVAASRPGVIRQ